MNLNSRTQYAIVILRELKANDASNSGALKLEAISSIHKISLHFLEQVARDLRLAGIIASRKGPGGGYFLASSKPVSLMDVINAVSKTEVKCSIEQSSLKDFVNQVQEEVYEALSGVYIIV